MFIEFQRLSLIQNSAFVCIGVLIFESSQGPAEKSFSEFLGFRFGNLNVSRIFVKKKNRDYEI